MNAAAEERIRSDYAIETHRECHICGKGHSLDQLVSALDNKTACIQTFTGRVMCYPVCWNQYLAEEWDEYLSQ